FPLVVCNLANIYLIISSACYLMMNKENTYFSTFVFIFGMFGLIRLIVVCYAGTIVSTAYFELIREIYETMPEWRVDSWVCFCEMQRMEDKFQVTIYRTFSVGQASILTMLGFALNYIVVLLQTENYGSV